jgi:hypothetical protein
MIAELDDCKSLLMQLADRSPICSRRVNNGTYTVISKLLEVPDRNQVTCALGRAPCICKIETSTARKTSRDTVYVGKSLHL